MFHIWISLIIITVMGILTNTRTKETYRSKIESQSKGSQDNFSFVPKIFPLTL